MRSSPLLGVAVFASLLGSATGLMAQNTDPTDVSPPTAGDDASSPASASGTIGAPPSVTMDASQMPPTQVSALKEGDNTLVTNGPVPDTAANRAKYGKPMSRTGQKTLPSGN